MDTRPTIIAFIIAVLGVVAALIMASNESIDASIGRTRHRLLGAGRLPIEKVHRITLQRGQQPAMIFERRGAQWWQLEPFEYPIDVFSIRQLITLAIDLEYVSVIEAGDTQTSGSFAALSLDPPAATIRYKWDDESLGFELGRRGIAGRAYLRVADDPRVFVVGQELHDRAVDMDPKEWRDRTIFREVSVEAARYDRRNGDQRMVLERDQRRWMMRQPAQTRADASAVEQLFQTLARVEVGGYMLDQPDDLSRFGLNNPAAEIAVTTERVVDPTSVLREPRTQRLLIGSPIGLGSQDRFAMIEGLDTVVRLRAAALAELFVDPQLFADPTGTGVQPADIKRIRIMTAGNELMLERDLERWVAPRAGRVEVSYNAVQTLLQQICQMPAPTVEFREYPIDLEIATVTLQGYDLKPLDTVRIAREPDDGRWALENGDNVLRIFPASMDIPLVARDFGLETGVGGAAP